MNGLLATGFWLSGFILGVTATFAYLRIRESREPMFLDEPIGEPFGCRS